MQFEHVLFIVQNPIKIHVHKLFYLELQTIFLPITKYDNAFTNSEDEIFYIVYHIVLCYIFCNSFVLSKNWEKLQLKKNYNGSFCSYVIISNSSHFYDKYHHILNLFVVCFILCCLANIYFFLQF